MSLVLSDHLRRQARRRGIEEAILRAVAEAPEQVAPIRPGREVRQSRVPFPPSGDTYLGGWSWWLGRHRNRSHRLSNQQDRQVLEGDMNVTYDADTDTLTIVLSDAPVAESDEDKPGVIIDYDDQGNLVSIEVLDASARVQDPRSVTLSA
jgi:uncharacterized protein YuzE